MQVNLQGAFNSMLSSAVRYKAYTTAEKKYDENAKATAEYRQARLEQGSKALENEANKIAVRQAEAENESKREERLAGESKAKNELTMQQASYVSAEARMVKANAKQKEIENKVLQQTLDMNNSKSSQKKSVKERASIVRKKGQVDGSTNNG